MGSQHNKETFRRFVEAVPNGGDLSAIELFMAEDVVVHHPQLSEPSAGHEAVKALTRAGRAAFPDIRVEIEELLGVDDWVVAQLKATGTNTGDLPGLGASGKGAAWSMVHIVRFSDGVIVEDRVTFDQLGLLQQLGFMPSSAPADG